MLQILHRDLDATAGIFGIEGIEVRLSTVPHSMIGQYLFDLIYFSFDQET
jgi:hypothetical protein